MVTISDFCTDDARKMDYLGGDLSPAEKREMEQHLRNCFGCRCELDDLSLLSGRLKELPPHECPDEMVVSAIAALDRYERLGRRFRRARQVVLAVLGLLGLVGTVALFLTLQSNPFSSLVPSNLSINLEIVRFVVVLVVLSGIPACLDGLGFLVVRRNVVHEQ